MKKGLALLLGAVMVMGTLVGCGGTETKETTADSKNETQAANGDKTWIIAMDTVFKPFEYTNANNEFVGIDVDIIKAVAEDQGFNIEIQSLGWDAALLAVQTGQADGLMAGASIKQERIDSGWIFSDSYYDGTQTFVVGKGSGISSFEDLEGKNVAVKNGTAGMDFANSIKDTYGFTVSVFEDSPTMYQDVILGNSVACVEDKPIMAYSIQESGLALEIPAGMESEVTPYGFAIMHEENQELLDMFNAGLANIKANGTYDAILATYLGE